MSNLVPATSPQPSPAGLLRAGRYCDGEGCPHLVLQGRFCGECVTDAAKHCAGRIEADLLLEGFQPGTAELKSMLAGAVSAYKPLRWFQEQSPLGTLSYLEALDFCMVVDQACKLVAGRGVAALSELEPRVLGPTSGDRRPHHYAGTPFDPTIWAGQADTATGKLPRPGVMAVGLGAVSGACTVVLLLLVVVGVMAW